MKLMYSKVYTHIDTDLSARIHTHMCVNLVRDTIVPFDVFAVLFFVI